MRRAFTLLELLAVIGIMGMLGVAAAASYGALVNGMKERSACAAASAILREASERARIDRLPTVVYCYNVCVKEPAGDDESGVVVGMMTAIRRVGRITQVRGQRLYDEFADLDLSYECVEDESDFNGVRGHRLFRFNDEQSVKNRMEYSVVADAVYRDPNQVVTVFSGVANNPQNQTNLLTAAFYNLNTSDREPSGGWKIGDGYAAEFSELQLPDGFVFGQQLPTRAGEVKEFKALRFDPDSASSDTVDIFITRPNASGVPQATRKAGMAYADETQGV